MAKKKYKYKNRKVSNRDWQQLSEDAQLREAYTRFASSVQQAQQVAEARSLQVGKPASHIIDLREAGRILEQHPQLMSFIIGVQERMLAEQSARTLPNEWLSTKASPTGSSPQSGTSELGGWANDYLNKDQPQGVPNARTLRDWADNDEWVNAAINYYVERVSRADIAILPADERLPYNRGVEKSIQLLLDQPNELGDTWPSLIKMGVRDYFTLGRWFWSKNMNTKRQPMALYQEDAATMKVFAAWSGDSSQPHFLYNPDGIAGRTKIPLRDDEVVYIPDGISSYRLSYSRVQALRNVIISDLKASESAARMVDQKPPPHIIQIPGANEQQIRTLRTTFDSNSAGRQEVLFLGGPNPAQVKPLVYSLKDQQWMEWMTYLAQKIAAIFGITPQDLGFIQDVNRSTADSQQDISENKGLIPFLLQIEENLNRQLLADFAPRIANGRTDITKLNLRVVFPEISEAARMMHAEKVVNLATKSLAGLPSMTINQCLLAMGQEPLEHGGNTFWISTMSGPMPWLSYDNDYGPHFGPDGMPLGTQDTEGGPTVDDTSTDDVGNKDNNPDTPNAANEGGSSPSSTNETTSSTDSGFQNTQKNLSDMRKPGVVWNPYMMSPTTTKAKPPSKPLPEELQERKHLAATVTRIFEDRAKQAERQLKEKK